MASKNVKKPENQPKPEGEQIAPKPGYNESTSILCGNILQFVLKDIWRKERIPGNPNHAASHELFKKVHDNITDSLMNQYLSQLSEASLKADDGKHLKLEETFEMLRRLCSFIMWYLIKYHGEERKHRVLSPRWLVKPSSIVPLFTVFLAVALTYFFVDRNPLEQPVMPFSVATASHTQQTRNIQKDPSSAEHSTEQSTISKHDKKEWDEEIHNFTKPLRTESSHVFYAERAIERANDGYYELAISDCNKAIELNPKFGFAYHVRGMTLQLINRTREAKQDFIKGCSFGEHPACEAYEQLTGKAPPL